MCRVMITTPSTNLKKKCIKDLKSIKARGADGIKSEMLETVDYKTLNNLLSLQ